MLKSFFLNLLFPINCLGCRREGLWLCESCFKKIKFSNGEKKSNLAADNLTGIFIAGDYDDPLLAGLIKKFKYNFITALGPILARWLILYWSGQLIASELDRDDFIVMPVPLSKKRARWRGFNQTEILAQELSAHFGYRLNHELKRSGRRPPQVSLGEKERAENVKNVFSWSGGDLNGQAVILLDDLITTGATLNEAARILRSAGAGRVYGLVLAKG